MSTECCGDAIKRRVAQALAAHEARVTRLGECRAQRDRKRQELAREAAAFSKRCAAANLEKAASPAKPPDLTRLENEVADLDFLTGRNADDSIRDALQHDVKPIRAAIVAFAARVEEDAKARADVLRTELRAKALELFAVVTDSNKVEELRQLRYAPSEPRPVNDRVYEARRTLQDRSNDDCDFLRHCVSLALLDLETPAPPATTSKD